MKDAGRYLTHPILDALAAKMVFIGGPRQVGKTTLARSLLAPGTEEQAYFNWDYKEHRGALRAEALPAAPKVLVLDEVHKFVNWRRLVKGIHDVRGDRQKILVTGSARLDLYRKGGDSLQGRYRYFRLHPFTVSELMASTSVSAGEAVASLLRFGGFPEPLFTARDDGWRIWQRERMARIIDGDLRDLERVKETSLVELLVDALPSRVGSPLSVKSLREDLEVAHETAERYLKILEHLYVCFRIPPYGAPRIKAVKKEQKLYLNDWSSVPDEGARFENMVACHLLKYCHWQEDVHGYRMELRYLRDVLGREIDFVVLRDRKPLFAVECKLSGKATTAASAYFRARTPIPRFYQTHLGDEDVGDPTGGTRLIPFATLCREENLP